MTFVNRIASKSLSKRKCPSMRVSRESVVSRNRIEVWLA